MSSEPEQRRDLANELIRATYHKNSMLPVATQRSPLSLREALVHAKRFVADEGMSAFMAELAHVPFKVAQERWHDVLASLRHTARLPFPSLFIQHDGKAFKRGLMRVDQNSKDARGVKIEAVSPDEVTPAIGWLFEMDRHDEHLIWMQVFTDGGDAGLVALPVRYAYRSDDRGFDPRFGIDIKPNMLLHGLLGCHDANFGVQYAEPLDKTPERLKVTHICGDKQYETHFIVAEFCGDVRYALCLLATLNDIPKVETVVRPAKSYFGDGRIRRYLDYTTLRLTLPVRGTTLTLAKRLIAAARRGWHEVRPHWRVYHRGERFCANPSDHVWLEADETGHANCKQCDARRVWIVLPGGRGDPTISVMTHKYVLTHPKD